MKGKLGGLVLAGGASRRMGQDKAFLKWGGSRAVDRAFELAVRAGACEVLISGGDYGLPFVADPQPHSGPVSGVMAGAEALARLGCDRMLVVAVDTPALAVGDVAPLLLAGAPGAAYEGSPLPMMIAFDAIPADALDGWPLRRLAERASLTILPCENEVRLRLRGANNPAERAALAALFFPPKA